MGRITITDIRRAGYCARGAKSWFEGKGLDFRAFLRDGMDEDAWAALGDAHADEVLRRKREYEGVAHNG